MPGRCPENLDDLAKDLLCLSNEALVQKCWHWYGPLMFRRRLEQVRLSRDRTSTATRNCTAEPAVCLSLTWFIAPSWINTSCEGAHIGRRGRGLCAAGMPECSWPTVCKHRLRRALHRPEDSWCSLEVQLAGCAPRWQPACTVSQDALASYFGVRADARIRARWTRRLQLRKQGAAGKKGRIEKSFVASWSSNGPRAASECSTHMETDAHISAAARTAGFLTTVSASGIVAHVDELICAESLSQRYRFLAIVASHMPDLKIVVHDDACHLRLMAEAIQNGTSMAVRLGTDMAYIVDEYHSSGHVGKWCSENCMPQLEANQALLDTFPTNICETMNSELSPLGHVIHHMGGPEEGESRRRRSGFGREASKETLRHGLCCSF